ncbi:ComEC/Rec2 family competence protein [Ruania albidiflava]|uniref:ComEC/Rec2 family competence protein n=1 Tax=Ruania albidiflava TaxID=366586 RepID=UPI0003B4008F|nr:ComEC/Rec2 family competence protein [Ruania albidiflava]
MSTHQAQPDPWSGPGQPTAVPAAGLDLRLVPAAVLAWLVCGVGIGLVADAVWVGVLLLLLVAAGLLRRLRRRVRARHRQAGDEALAAWVLALLLAAALLATVAVRGADRADQVRALDGTEASVTLRVQREARPHEDGALADALLLAVDGRGGTLRTPVLVLADAAWLELPFGARVQTQARLAGTGPGEDRTFLVFPETVERVQEPVGWRAPVAQIRAGLAELCAEFPPAGRGLVPGIALGDTRALPAALAADMRTTGLTHLTAISGAHVALLLAVLMVLLLWAPRWLRAGAGAVALVAFVALVRPEGSVLRAAVMGGVLLLGLALRRPRSGLPALCVAAVVLLAADPWISRSYGFALSVAATAGLLLLAPPLSARLSAWLPRPLALAIAIPVAAQLVCLPVLVLLQPRLPVYGVLANILAAPVVPPATVLGVGAALLAPVAPGPALVCAQAASWCAEWIAVVARACAALPGAG